jgi:hypothetical protein
MNDIDDSLSIFVLGIPRIPVGSGLALEGLGTFNGNVAYEGLFASKPAPTLDRCKREN